MGQLSIDRPFVSPDVVEAVRRLRAEGLEPTAEDICWLFDLTRKQADTGLCTTAPVVIEGGYADGSDIILRRCPPGVRMWWDAQGRELARAAYGEDKERIVLTLAWALASGLGAELETLSASALRARVTPWIWALGCSADVVALAVLRALGEKVPGGTEVLEIRGFDPGAYDKTRFEPVIVLAGVYGLDPLKLVWEYSEAQLQELYAASATVQGIRNGMGLPKVSGAAVDVRSIMVFRAAVEKIRTRLREEKTSEPC